MHNSLPLTTNGVNHTIACSCRNAMVFTHFRVRVVNPNPPVPVRILFQASVSAMFIRCLEMSQVFKTHSCVTQDEEGIPRHRSEHAGFLALLHGFFSLF